MLLFYQTIRMILWQISSFAQNVPLMLGMQLRLLLNAQGPMSFLMKKEI